MASSPRKSLAGQAAQAARKVMSRRSPKPAAVAVEPAQKVRPATKAAPVKKAAPAAKKAAPVKKAAPAAKKTAPAKKAAPAAKKTAPVTKTVPVKKAAPAAKKAVPVKKAAPAAKKTTAPASKAPAKKAAPVKKAASTRKAPASALAVKDGEGAWTKAELAEVLGELNAQRTHSAEIIEKQERELFGLMRDSGDGAGHDQADMGATSFERDHELTVLSNERDKLAQIERALSRIDDGTYGVCESCGNPIGKMRVMAFPRATLCMPCKQREERR